MAKSGSFDGRGYGDHSGTGFAKIYAFLTLQDLFWLKH